MRLYARMYVTLQDDGSEDDLSYIKLYNYGGKVVTNRMHGYLRMRIAQFLTTVSRTTRTRGGCGISLSRVVHTRCRCDA